MIILLRSVCQICSMWGEMMSTELPELRGLKRKACFDTHS